MKYGRPIRKEQSRLRSINYGQSRSPNERISTTRDVTNDATDVRNAAVAGHVAGNVASHDARDAAVAGDAARYDAAGDANVAEHDAARDANAAEHDATRNANAARNAVVAWYDAHAVRR